MREYLFRGKDVKTGEWRYGNLEVGGVLCLIKLGIHEWFAEIDTIGQYTGLLAARSNRLDRDGKEDRRIFEGDIVECDMTGHLMRYELWKGRVEMNDGCMEVVFNRPFEWIDGLPRKRSYVKCFVVNHALKIIGNLWDTPELLAEGEKG